MYRFVVSAKILYSFLIGGHLIVMVGSFALGSNMMDPTLDRERRDEGAFRALIVMGIGFLLFIIGLFMNLLRR